MDEQRFDKLAKAFAGGSNRRGFLKRIAGIAAGAAVVAVPAKVGATGKYCSSDYDCNDYNNEVCGDYGQCVCDYGYKDCGGSCIPEESCCGNYDCGDHEVCEYGTCVCDYGYKDCNGKCIPEESCCSGYDCGNHEVCDYGQCVCEYGYKDCDGKCVPEDGCCYDHDCKYGETCDYGTCVEPSEEPETETSAPADTGPNYAKQLNRTCNNKCIKAGRKASKKKKARLTSAKVKRLRNTCKRRCARNTR